MKREGFTLIEPSFDRLRTVRQGERSAFTLIELLVVVAIIALLVSILVPSLQAAKELAILAVCAGDLHGVHVAMQMYGAGTSMDYPLSDEVEPLPSPPPRYSAAAFGWAGPPGQLFSQNYLANIEIAYCPGLGGLTKFGWPAGSFGPNNTHIAYEFAQLRRCDLWAGNPWRADMNWSNTYWGGMLFRCATSVYERDPRGWTHQNIVNEIRNDGGNRRRTVPVTGMIVYGPWNVQVDFEPGYVCHDGWWLSK
jgi:prepilin-type N-terminal cleavage/methylation domain-containing protein